MTKNTSVDWKEIEKQNYWGEFLKENEKYHRKKKAKAAKPELAEVVDELESCLELMPSYKRREIDFDDSLENVLAQILAEVRSMKQYVGGKQTAPSPAISGAKASLSKSVSLEEKFRAQNEAKERQRLREIEATLISGKNYNSLSAKDLHLYEKFQEEKRRQQLSGRGLVEAGSWEEIHRGHKQAQEAPFADFDKRQEEKIISEIKTKLSDFMSGKSRRQAPSTWEMAFLEKYEASERIRKQLRL